jgi:hypothetical protein
MAQQLEHGSGGVSRVMTGRMLVRALAAGLALLVVVGLSMIDVRLGALLGVFLALLAFARAFYGLLK